MIRIRQRIISYIINRDHTFISPISGVAQFSRALNKKKKKKSPKAPPSYIQSRTKTLSEATSNLIFATDHISVTL